MARRKSGARLVRWVVGDAMSLPATEVDMVTMTGNVGEHLNDGEWSSALVACRNALRPGGHLVFGARGPAGRPWAKWSAESTVERADVPGVGAVTHWIETTDEGPRHFSFRWTFQFDRDGVKIDWSATFRIRTREELVNALTTAGFDVVDVDDREFLFVARKPAVVGAQRASSNSHG